ncbi:MAG TPA: hypothetical protein DEP40_05915, partial [Enterococcus sp.]|nr:hypothetical protein [Enterococcus sp.]
MVLLSKVRRINKMENIVLLHTNDLHSHLENWPKIRRFIDQKKREN